MINKNNLLCILFSLISFALTYVCIGDLYGYFGIQFIIISLLTVIFALSGKILSCVPVVLIMFTGIYKGGYAGGVVSGITLLLSVLAAYFIRKKCTTSRLVLVLATGIFFSVVGGVYSFMVSTGVDVINNVTQVARKEFISYLSLLQNNMTEAQTNQLTDTLIAYFKNIFPSMLITASLMYAYLCSCIISFLLRLLNAAHMYKVSFSQFMCDKVTTIVLFISFLCSMFVNTGVLNIVFVNIFVILVFVFQACGLSLVDYYFKKRGMRAFSRFLIIGLLFMFLTSGISLIIIVMAAIIDSFKNFRKLGVTPSDKTE